MRVGVETGAGRTTAVELVADDALQVGQAILAGDVEIEVDDRMRQLRLQQLQGLVRLVAGDDHQTVGMVGLEAADGMDDLDDRTELAQVAEEEDGD